jgi:hypothetical protein
MRLRRELQRLAAARFQGRNRARARRTAAFCTARFTRRAFSKQYRHFD